MSKNLMIPVIMCGGAGTRLWPVSRESMPKQFVSLIDACPTFQQTLARVRDASIFDRPIVITNSDFRFIVAQQMRESEIEGDIVLEPERRDSAMAVGVAAALAAERDPASTILVLAADHVVRDGEAYSRACRMASGAAADGHIVTFGVNPTFPSTQYGYIRPGPALNGGLVFAVDSFVEKPDAAAASRYIEARYLWNSGNFVFRADVMLNELIRFEPEIAYAAKAAVSGMTRDLDFQRLPVAAFSQAPKKSIDYAVMERTDRAVVVPIDCGWSDVGSWNAVWEESDHDADGNAGKGSVTFLSSRNSLAYSDDAILTAVVGLDNVVVVTTSDAVLVTPRDRADQVKELVERLKT